jgi:DNA (cytosine-5)-methyltransferase 1
MAQPECSGWKGPCVTAYYNEIDPYAAQWLRNLIAAGHMPDGEVDERSIAEVEPGDLRGFDECHFFAGIGGWPLALRMAGWTGGPVWTGSCPCQPFSAAGKQRGTDDERHLWPEFLRLIAECRPPAVFGEQVASKLGRAWLAGVRADLEALGYGVGAADLCAASIGAPHIRQRLWWVGNLRVSDARHAGSPRTRGNAQSEGAKLQPRDDSAEERAVSGGLDDAEQQGPQGRERPGDLELHGAAGAVRPTAEASIPDAWDNTIWLPCADGKARRIKPGIEPLAHGISNRVGRLRAYGNAIVPQVAAQFVRACM